jgi:hypothetical protein
MIPDPQVLAHYRRLRRPRVALRKLFPRAMLGMVGGIVSVYIADYILSESLFWGVLFAVVAIILFVPGFVFGIGLLYYLIKLCLEQPLQCAVCHAVNAPPYDWVCGFCHATHSYVKYFQHSYLLECRDCKRLPHSLICSNCRHPIIFDPHAFHNSPKASAWYLDFPPVPEAPAKVGVSPPQHIDDDLR